MEEGIALGRVYKHGIEDVPSVRYATGRYDPPPPTAAATAAPLSDFFVAPLSGEACMPEDLGAANEL